MSDPLIVLNEITDVFLTVTSSTCLMFFVQSLYLFSLCCSKVVHSAFLIIAYCSN